MQNNFNFRELKKNGFYFNFVKTQLVVKTTLTVCNNILKFPSISLN